MRFSAARHALATLAGALCVTAARSAPAQTTSDSTRPPASAPSPQSPRTVPARVALRSEFAFYADNTEFFTPYRLGETILGSQFTTAVVARPTDAIELHAGVFGDYRYGSDRFLDRAKPVLSLRYHTATGVGILGTLDTERRHGFLEPIQVTTLELTRPLEYGAQWTERRRHFTADVFMNWQRLLDRTTREVIDYGGVAAFLPVSWISLEFQAHGVHHGGQVYDGSEPITNNVATALGARVSGPVPVVGYAEAAAYRVRGAGNIDPEAPATQPTNGHGTYLRGALGRVQRVQTFGIYWQGRDFLSADGDRNYSSEGFTYDRYYRSRRTYVELGVLRRVPAGRGAALDLEARLHRVDHTRSTDPILGQTWEYSYRIVARLPLEARIK